MGSELLIMNERLKAIAGVLLNLGTAMLVAVAAKLWSSNRVDWEGATWLLASMALFFAGYKTLLLLQADDKL